MSDATATATNVALPVRRHADRRGRRGDELPAAAHPGNFGAGYFVLKWTWVP